MAGKPHSSAGHARSRAVECPLGRQPGLCGSQGAFALNGVGRVLESPIAQLIHQSAALRDVARGLFNQFRWHAALAKGFGEACCGAEKMRGFVAAKSFLQGCGRNAPLIRRSAPPSPRERGEGRKANFGRFGRWATGEIAVLSPA